jgi:hypothetical protein
LDDACGRSVSGAVSLRRVAGLLDSPRARAPPGEADRRADEAMSEAYPRAAASGVVVLPQNSSCVTESSPLADANAIARSRLGATGGARYGRTDARGLGVVAGGPGSSSGGDAGSDAMHGAAAAVWGTWVAMEVGACRPQLRSMHGAEGMRASSACGMGLHAKLEVPHLLR